MNRAENVIGHEHPVEENLKYVEFEVIIVVTMKRMVFWVETL
jgi:hypothetical protein